MTGGCCQIRAYPALHQGMTSNVTRKTPGPMKSVGSQTDDIESCFELLPTELIETTVGKLEGGTQIYNQERYQHMRWSFHSLLMVMENQIYKQFMELAAGDEF